jgi:hypothetical protein
MFRLLSVPGFRPEPPPFANGMAPALQASGQVVELAVKLEGDVFFGGGCLGRTGGDAILNTNRVGTG